jgi:hypothetical protein
MGDLQMGEERQKPTFFGSNNKPVKTKTNKQRSWK